MSKLNKSPYLIASSLEANNIPFAWVSVIDSTKTLGPTKGRMLVKEDGKSFGTLGLIEFEEKACTNAIACLKRGKGGLFNLHCEKDDTSITIHVDIGCKGPSLIIIGGGKIAIELSKLAFHAGFSPVVIETRKDVLNKSKYPSYCDLLYNVTIKKALSEISVDKTSKFIILSNNFLRAKDLKAMADTPVSYIGLQNTSDHFINLLSEIELDSKQILKFHYPVGLPSKEYTAYQSALSLLSAILFERQDWSNKRVGSNNPPIIVRGAGEISSAIILKLHGAGLRVIALDIAQPTIVRRLCSFAQAVYDTSIVVEGVSGELIKKEEKLSDIYALIDKGIIPVVIDPEATLIKKVHPFIVIDAIHARKNLGLKKDDAPLVIALGPGFTAGKDCDLVIETMVDENLGRIITEGPATKVSKDFIFPENQKNGITVMSPSHGTFSSGLTIGSPVAKGDIIAAVDGKPIYAPSTGSIRGILQSGLTVSEGLEVAEISDKEEDEMKPHGSNRARAIAAGVLEAVENFIMKRG